MKHLMMVFCLMTVMAVTAHAQSIIDWTNEQESLTTFAEAIAVTDLLETLQEDGTYTLFAPSNEAIAALPDGTWTSLMEPDNRDQLLSILRYHVIPGKVTLSDMTAGKVTTLQGEEVELSLAAETFHINGATLSQSDAAVSNGVVHIIDQVMMPPSRLKN